MEVWLTSRSRSAWRHVQIGGLESGERPLCSVKLIPPRVYHAHFSLSPTRSCWMEMRLEIIPRGRMGSAGYARGVRNLVVFDCLVGVSFSNIRLFFDSNPSFVSMRPEKRLKALDLAVRPQLEAFPAGNPGNPGHPAGNSYTSHPSMG